MPKAAGKRPSLFTRLAVEATRRLMSLWYDVTVIKKTPGLDGPIRGALIMLGPHTGYDDPPLVNANIFRLLPASPVAHEALFTATGVKTVMGAGHGNPGT